MENPYFILGISQNATKAEIKKAELLAMKEKKYTLQEISTARNQLMNPSKRLVADFLYPSKIKAKRPKLISLNVKVNDIDLNSIDENAYNSLK